MATRKTLLNAAFLIVQPLLLNAISIPATAYIIHELGPLHYGQWATAAAIVAATGCLTSLGLRPQFVRLVAQTPENAAEALSYQLGMRCALTLLAMALALLFCTVMRYEPLVFICVCIAASGMLLTTISTTFIDILQGLQRIRTYASINMLVGLALTVASVIAVWQNTGAIGLSLAYLTGPILGVVLLYLRIHRLGIPVRFRWNTERIRALLKESSGWTVNLLVNSVRDRLEQLVLPKMVGMSAMGIFASGTMPVDRLLIVPDGLSGAFFPTIARDSASGNQAAEAEVRRLIIISVTVCLALSVLFVSLAGPIAHLLFPRSADACRSVIQITAMALPLIGFNYPSGLALLAVGKQAELARVGLYSQFVHVAISLLLIWQYGLQGACWSYVLRFAIPTAFNLPLFARIFPRLLPRLPLARIVLSAMVMAALLRFTAVASNSTLLMCAVWGATASVVYLGMLVILGVLKRTELQALLFKRFATPPSGTAAGN